MALLFTLSIFAAFYARTAASTCDEVYTVGDDQLCLVSLTDFTESCVTFDAALNIVATNGLAMDPMTEDLYLVASIGAKNGDRVLFRVDESTGTMVLDTIATYTLANDKLAGIAFDCEGDLYAITATQADHSFYHVDLTDGTLTQIADLDVSTKGNGVTYDPMDDHFYRVGGETQLDIEQLDHYTGNVTADYYVTDDSITGLRAIGYYKDDLIFLIDSGERLFELDTLSGDVVAITTLNTTRKHKGIVCTDAASMCDAFFSSTQMAMDTTQVMASTADTTGTMDASTTEEKEADMAARHFSFCGTAMFVLVLVCVSL